MAAITRDQIDTRISFLKKEGVIGYYYKIGPTNELLKNEDGMIVEDPSSTYGNVKYLKNPDAYFEAVRGVASTYSEAKKIIADKIAELTE